MKKEYNTVLITGGSSGIGRELAARFHQQGNQVIVVGRDPIKLARLSEALPGIHTIRCDLANSEDRNALILEIEKNHPDLNVLINNAGVQYNYDSPESLCNADRFEPEITTNLLAPMELTARLIPMLLQKQEAAIVNVSSGLAFAPKKCAPVYCATKAGLHSFTLSLRNQLEGSPVKVFELIPPLAETAMTEGRGGSKISVREVAEALLKGFAADRFEINVGPVALLRGMLRIAPRWAHSLVKNKA